MSKHEPWERCDFDWDSFADMLSNEFCSSAFIKEKGTRVKYLFDYLSHLQANTVIIEYDYTDRDYLEDYAAYYVRCFKDYRRRCKRLHFFSTAVTEDCFKNLVLGKIDPSEEDRIRSAYVGFIVARPLPDKVIGRTVLKTYETDDGRRHYTCTREYQPNLFGVDFKVRSLAYQEQDKVLAACATVSLWCAFHKCFDLFGTQRPTPSLITQAANQFTYASRPIPSHGLNINQVCNAIRSVGLEPEVFKIKKDTQLISLCYAYLKMEIPVILAISISGMPSRHAVTITGFSLLKERIRKAEIPSDGSFPTLALNIDAFFAHDDQIGPYARMVVKDSGTYQGFSYPLTFEGEWKLKTDPSTKAQIYPEYAIIPVYHKIRVTFVDIQKWTSRFHNALSYLKIFDAYAYSRISNKNAHWDVFLTSVNCLKREYRRKKKDAYGVLAEQCPKYIWRAILRNKGATILEFLMDATDIERSFPIYKLIWEEDRVRTAFISLLQDRVYKGRLRHILTIPFFDFLINSSLST